MKKVKLLLLLTDSIGEFEPDLILVDSDGFTLTFRLFISLTKLLDNFTLLFDLFLKTAILSLLLKHLFLCQLLVFHQTHLPGSLLFKFKLNFAQLVRSLFLSFFESCAS